MDCKAINITPRLGINKKKSQQMGVLKAFTPFRNIKRPSGYHIIQKLIASLKFYVKIFA